MMTIQEVFLEELIRKYKLRSNTREQQRIWNKHFFCYFLNRKLNYSHTKIGELLGHKDHCRSAHSSRTVDKFISINDKVFIESIQEICKDLQEFPESEPIILTKRNDQLTQLINFVFTSSKLRDVKSYINEHINPREL